MTRGVPVLITNDQPSKFMELNPVSFSRQDTASFDEDLLQAVVDEAPSVLPIRDFYPTVKSICSLGREIPVDLGGKEGFIDNLLVTNDGHLILVETKLFRNREATREVIAQTLQYGMTLNKMPLSALEERIKRGDKRSPVIAEHKFSSITDHVRHLATQNHMPAVIDEFEETLERQQRIGEMLLLIVSDGIHASVEKITKWMNDITGSAPFTFGLVELCFHSLPDGSRIVTPRTLLRTKEVARHVVVVDLPASVTATVSDVSGVRQSEPRTIKSSPSLVTKGALLAAVADSHRITVQNLIDQLESIGLESYSTTGWLNYGVVDPNEPGKPQCLLSLNTNGVTGYHTAKLRKVLREDVIVEHVRRMNAIATFWRQDQAAALQPAGVMVRYDTIINKVPDIASALDSIRLKASEAFAEQTI